MASVDSKRAIDEAVRALFDVAEAFRRLAEEAERHASETRTMDAQKLGEVVGKSVRDAVGRLGRPTVTFS